MKKKILLALFAVLVASIAPLTAQISFGVSGTPAVINTSKIYGDFTNLDKGKSASDYDSYSPMVNVGFTIDYKFKNNFTFASGFGYKMQGFQDESVSEVFKLDYLEIPLLGGYSIGETTQFYANVGPSIKFLTRAEHEYLAADGSTEDEDLKTDIELFRSVVLSANASVGVRHHFTDIISVHAEFRYGFDLTSVTGDTTDDDNDTYYGEKLLATGEEWSFANARFSQYALTVGVSFTILD